jgi:hypothetical protein
MSTVAGMDAADRLSARTLARIAGALYLVNIILGAFAVGFAPSIPGAYRLGVAAHVVIGLTNVPLALIFYELFRVVSRRLAVLVVFFTLVATSIEMAFVAAQLPSHSVSAAGYDVSSIFFALYGVTAGWLTMRSGFLPRVVGALLVVGSLCYFGYGFTDILAPAAASRLVPWIQLPSLVGELSFTLWLLIAGVNLERWLVMRDQRWPAEGAARQD